VVYEDGLRIGARVRHQSFGVGTVVAIEGRGEQQKVTVLFPRVGRKKLVAKFAGLEPA
jgi:DNA helicase-2/ATP-dependent DNA helicase PcrA